ncbi:signal peptidase I [uncultured Paenibacillus sp.]|uniref:signal peptidase I n=1 Tax=Paenibacillus sp. TaxID=58172 RepID=UPI0037DC71AB
MTWKLGDSVEKEDRLYVKRIIGLPGENIEYRRNQLYINNERIHESVFSRTKTNDFRLEEVTFQNRITENSYFVMGDNRSHSMD